jgi:ketosteroid isomerase-like protein
MRALVFLAVAALSACTTTEHTTVTAAPVIGAERAFAARAHEAGWIPAFCEFSASDSQLVGRLGLINAHERMCGLPDDGERNLYWAPSFAGISSSGDLGFTTGPASYDATRTPAIQYFTVWRRQADGTWKWIYDGGPGQVQGPGPYLGDGAEVPTLPPVVGVGSAGAAMAQVNSIEASASNPAALRRYLAPGAHVYRTARARAYGGPEAEANLIQPSADVSYVHRRTEASSGGDLVFTLGEAHWTLNGEAHQGFYARIWQYNASGWRIVYDQLAPWTPPAAQSSRQ